MSIRNPEKLREVLAQGRRIARVFSRHSYGMFAWVDLFGAKLLRHSLPSYQAILALLIADNRRHAGMFRRRASELGESPERYEPSPIARRIYELLESYDNPFDELAYALGSLLHFRGLLWIYRDVADAESRDVVEAVLSDVEGHIGMLEGWFGDEADTPLKARRKEEITAIAEGIYADREEAELEWYES